MAENVQANSPMDTPRPPDAEYGWHDVAREMTDWHPDLQEHAARKLDEHGVARPDRIAVPRLAIVADSEPEVSESSTLVAPKSETISEIPRNPSEKIVDAFADGQNALLKLSNDPQFHAKCLKKGIDPYVDMDKPKYWRIFREHAGDRVRKLREKVGNTPQLSAFELMSATPSFIFGTAAINNGQNNLPREKALRLKETLGSFNGLIRKLATEFPETKASDVVLGLLNTANTTIEDTGLRRKSEQAIRECVRGAQHEKVFGQILNETGRESRESTPAEDQDGVDYVSQDRKGRPLYVDVKASLTKIQRGKGAHEDAFMRSGDRIVMYSLVKDEELKDTFYIPQEVAVRKADALNTLLDEASVPKASYSLG